MSSVSSPVSSNQTGNHKDLDTIVKKHLSTTYQKPFHTFSNTTFENIDDIQKHIALPIILDSGCGTGDSSHNLSKIYSDHLIIGIDKSEKRLAKNINTSSIYHKDNLILARADLIDMWRLIKNARWEIKKHFLLYPNPWPKKDQIKRRWHAHPVFPEMLAICNNIELRTNWKIYAEEFSLALTIAISKNATIKKITPCEIFISPFERKYSESGHTLYKLTTI